MEEEVNMEGGETVVGFLDAVKYRMRHPEGRFLMNSPAPDQHRVNLCRPTQEGLI